MYNLPHAYYVSISGVFSMNARRALHAFGFYFIYFIIFQGENRKDFEKLRNFT